MGIRGENGCPSPFANQVKGVGACDECRNRSVHFRRSCGAGRGDRDGRHAQHGSQRAVHGRRLPGDGRAVPDLPGPADRHAANTIARTDRTAAIFSRRFIIFLLIEMDSRKALTNNTESGHCSPINDQGGPHFVARPPAPPLLSGFLPARTTRRDASDASPHPPHLARAPHRAEQFG